MEYSRIFCRHCETKGSQMIGPTSDEDWDTRIWWTWDKNTLGISRGDM